VIYPLITEHVAEPIGSNRVLAISKAHCNLTGNSISIYPFTLILLLGETFSIIGAVVLTKPGLKDTEQALKTSLVNVTEELEESADMSVPISAIKESVVRAEDGFVTFDIYINTYSIKDAVLIAFDTVKLLPEIEVVKLVMACPSMTICTSEGLVSERLYCDGKMTVMFEFGGTASDKALVGPSKISIFLLRLRV